MGILGFERSSIEEILRSIEAGVWATRAAQRQQQTSVSTEQSTSTQSSCALLDVITQSQNVENSENFIFNLSGSRGFTLYVDAVSYGTPQGTWTVTIYGSGGSSSMAQLGTFTISSNGTTAFESSKWVKSVKVNVSTSSPSSGSGYNITIECVVERCQDG